MTQTAGQPLAGTQSSSSGARRARPEGLSLDASATLRWLWRVGPWALAAVVILTRLAFMTETLYAFDSANYALAVRDYYNVAHHRPHPPGYPLYVFFAKAIYLVVHDANRALVLEGIGLSAVAVLSTSFLARALFGRVAGLLAGLLLTFTVGFWGYGEVAYPYVGLAAETSTLALLAYLTIAGRRQLVVPLGLAVAVAGGIRWDGAIFCLALWLWALWSVPWRLRIASVGLAFAVVVAWFVPMVQLSGGWTIYRQAVAEYLDVWSPQSAYVVGGFASGEETQATYNLNFFVNYSRQMLGVGLLLLFYVLGRRFGPASLAADVRSRFLVVWTVPPILTYVFTHLGEAGYVLSLAPHAAILAGVAALDLGRETSLMATVLGARGWRWLPGPRVLGPTVVGALVAAILAWNVQAFLRGVGPGRLPDLRAHDATTSEQMAFLQAQPPGSTLVLAHDVIRQLEYYLPSYPRALLYTEYVPGWETVRTRTDVPAGVTQVVVLDSPLQVAPEDASRVRQVTLREQPRVTAWVLDARGARAVEHGYRFVRVVPQ